MRLSPSTPNQRQFWRKFWWQKEREVYTKNSPQEHAGEKLLPQNVNCYEAQERFGVENFGWYDALARRLIR